jgi:alkyl hydroperoxide reductase subunit AhpC
VPAIFVPLGAQEHPSPIALAGDLRDGQGNSSNRALPAFEWWRALDLRDLDGAQISFTNRWVVLAFLDPECPVANACLPVLDSLARSFRAKGVRVIGVYTDPSLNVERVRQHGREFSIEFPVLQDRNHRLVQICRVTCSSEVAVLDARGTVLYHGRIDNRVGEDGATRPQATQRDLETVLERLHAGEAGPFPARPGFGCFLPGAVSPP